MKKSHLVIVSIVAVLGVLLIFQSLSTTNNVTNGTTKKQVLKIEKVPDIKLTNLKGKDIKFSDFKNKVIVLNFWATWCPPCRAEFPSMLELTEYYKGKLVLITISQDNNPDVIKKFLKQFEPKHTALLKGESFQAVWDMGHQISGKTFNVFRFPESFVIDKNGFLVKKIPGAIDWMHPDLISYFDSLMVQE